MTNPSQISQQRKLRAINTSTVYDIPPFACVQVIGCGFTQDYRPTTDIEDELIFEVGSVEGATTMLLTSPYVVIAPNENMYEPESRYSLHFRGDQYAFNTYLPIPKNGGTGEITLDEPLIALVRQADVTSDEFLLPRADRWGLEVVRPDAGLPVFLNGTVIYNYEAIVATSFRRLKKLEHFGTIESADSTNIYDPPSVYEPWLVRRQRGPWGVQF